MQRLLSPRGHLRIDIYDNDIKKTVVALHRLHITKSISTDKKRKGVLTIDAHLLIRWDACKYSLLSSWREEPTVISSDAAKITPYGTAPSIILMTAYKLQNQRTKARGKNTRLARWRSMITLPTQIEYCSTHPRPLASRPRDHFFFFGFFFFTPPDAGPAADGVALEAAPGSGLARTCSVGKEISGVWTSGISTRLFCILRISERFKASNRLRKMEE